MVVDEDFRYGKAAFTPHNMTVEEFEAGILNVRLNTIPIKIYGLDYLTVQQTLNML